MRDAEAVDLSPCGGDAGRQRGAVGTRPAICAALEAAAPDSRSPDDQIRLSVCERQIRPPRTQPEIDRVEPDNWPLPEYCLPPLV